jgi:putative protease
MVKITVPISDPGEVEMLAESGAGEFYCGFVPPEWIERHGGAFWLNRRGPVAGNLQRIEDLCLLTERAHARSIPVYVTFNAPYYTADQQEMLIPLVDRLRTKAGIDGVIVSDVGFLSEVARLLPAVPVHASSVASAWSPAMLDFLSGLGAARVIFPRALSVAEIGALCEAAGDRLETEAFVMNEGCVFEEGYCMTTHRAAGAICVKVAEAPFRYVSLGGGGAPPPEATRAHLGDFRDWVWFQNGCGNSVSPDGIPNGPCGLCAVHDLVASGVDTLKVVGRGASPYRKLVGVQLVRAMLDVVEGGATRELAEQRARALRKSPAYCDAGYMCYYRGGA